MTSGQVRCIDCGKSTSNRWVKDGYCPECHKIAVDIDKGFCWDCCSFSMLEIMCIKKTSMMSIKSSHEEATLAESIIYYRKIVNQVI